MYAHLHQPSVNFTVPAQGWVPRALTKIIGRWRKHLDAILLSNKGKLASDGKADKLESKVHSVTGGLNDTLRGK